MLHLVHRVTVSIKPGPVKLEQAVSESLPHNGLVCMDPVPSSICARNAQEINIIRESVDSLCRDGADVQYMQYLNKSRITSPQTH